MDTEKKSQDTVIENPALKEPSSEQPDAVTLLASPKRPRNKFTVALDNYFKVTESKSDFKTEIIGGLTTFMAMAYILVVNPGLIAGPSGVSMQALFISTAIGAVVGTLLMALLAKLPFAQAPGMGLNAYFAFSVIGATGFGHDLTFANALFIVLISGILFLVLTIFGLREIIIDSIPKSVKIAMPAGIGLFIAFVGLQGSGLIIADGATLVSIANLNVFSAGITGIFPILVTVLSFIAIAVMSKHNVKGAILWGILGAAIFYYIFGYAGGVGAAVLNDKFANIQMNPIPAWGEWGTQAVGKVFTDGWKGIFTADRWLNNLMSFLSMVLAFAMVDMFDTVGTLLGTAKKAKMVDENGNLPNMKKALLCDSIATVAGAIAGTSTVTTYVESSAGVQEGARTGLASLITAMCFFVAMFFTPLAEIIPGCATAGALVYVGVLMIGGVREIDFSDVYTAVPAFLTITMMAFTYNISYGIAFGMISFCLLKAFSATIYAVKGAVIRGKATDTIADEYNNNEMITYLEKAKRTIKEVHPIAVVISVLFLIYFMFT